MIANSRNIAIAFALALGLPVCLAAQTAKTPAAPASAASIDSKAIETLHRSQQAMLALKTYSAECWTTLTKDKPASGLAVRHVFATVAAEKPNKIRYDGWELKGDPGAKAWARPAAAPTYTFVSNGSAGWKQFGKVYRKDNRVKPEQISTILEPWTGFYVMEDSAYGTAMAQRKANELREVRSLGQETVQGVSCNKVLVVSLSSYNGEKYDNRTTWYIGPDNLVRRSVVHVSFDDKPGVTRDATVTNIRPNAPVDRGLFAYAPPPGVKLELLRTRQTGGLAIGSPAPNFSALDSRNKPVKLSNYRGKVVIVDFWASWCGPCMASMPHNQTVMKKLKAQRLPVVLLAVDDGEPRGDFDAWVAKNCANFSALTFVHSPPSKGVSGGLFHVTGIPTQFVLDKRGIVRASFVGFGGPTDALERAVKAALAK